MVIGSNVASTSASPSTGRHNTFILGDKPLPNDSYVQTWRSELGGQVAKSLVQALFMPEDMQHYSDCQEKDISLKLKWHTIAVSTSFPPSPPFFFFLSVSPRLIFILLFLFVTVPGRLNDPRP